MNRLLTLVLLAAPLTALAAPATHGMDPRQVRAIVRAAHQERVEAVRANGRFFRKVAVGKDYRGERVVYHDQHVTALVDMTDPLHPRYDSERPDEDDRMAAVPASRRTHILVIPNEPREHIAEKLGDHLRLADFRATAMVHEAAEKIAKQLGIKVVDIYQNPSERIGVAYQHVHIIGERGSAAYPDLHP